MAEEFDLAEVQAAVTAAMTGASAAAGLAASRKIYGAVLDDWVKTLEAADSSSSPQRAEKEAAVVALWLAWADLEKKKKQWKAATQTELGQQHHSQDQRQGLQPAARLALSGVL